MRLTSYFSPKVPLYFVYMLQQVEYRNKAFLTWLMRWPNLHTVMHRKQLVRTRKAQALIIGSYLSCLLYVCVGVGLAWATTWAILVLLVLTPLISASSLVVAIKAGQIITSRNHGQEITAAEQLFARHPGKKIAIAGSYGKTTVKEILHTILSEGHIVAATPGNQNVSISHARWAQKLTSNEEFLLIEYGEGAPGDVERFAANTHPDIGIITGLAPNHLDHYKTLQNVAVDLFALADYLKEQEIYVNTASDEIKPYIKNAYYRYDEHGVRDWKITNVELSITGMQFVMQKGTKKLALQTQLVGRHLLGPLGLAVALSDDLGLTQKQIKTGIANTKPFEHRMQPRQLGGAWIIDDTYNGNVEGIRAGLSLLAELPATRKIYVTPGLVDQGEETERVHREIGQLIAAAQPDKVVLMRNSATDYMMQELKNAQYQGAVSVEDDPLGFYQNLDQFVAGGDLLLMQNDWTDNYA